MKNGCAIFVIHVGLILILNLRTHAETSTSLPLSDYHDIDGQWQSQLYVSCGMKLFMHVLDTLHLYLRRRCRNQQYQDLQY